MALTEFLLKDINVTVIGNFNPAILRHDFLARVCKFEDLGQPIEQSPPEIPTLSQIKYKDFWWTVELNRMIVRDTGLTGKAPHLVTRYLDALPHTPLFAAGINLFADLVMSDVPISSLKVSDAALIFGILGNFDASELDLTVKSRIISEESFIPLEIILNYITAHEAKVLLRMGFTDAPPCIHAHYNWEIRGLDTDRERIKLIEEQHNRVNEDFKGLMQNFLESSQDHKDKT